MLSTFFSSRHATRRLSRFFMMGLILIGWFGGFTAVNAAVSLDNGTGTVELPLSTNIASPVQATNSCASGAGTFSAQVMLGSFVPGDMTYYARFELDNGATFSTLPLLSNISVGNVNMVSGGVGSNYVIFSLTNPNALTSGILISDTSVLSFCVDAIQSANNKSPVNLKYSFYSNKVAASGGSSPLVTKTATYFKFMPTNCANVTEIPSSECQSLLDLYNSTGGVNWTNKTGWNENNTPCSWFGVTCSAGHVKTIELLGNNLKGSLPNLNSLPNLTEIFLIYNQLSGSIPNFSNLPNLVTLFLHNNQLSGSIPDFSNLPNLMYLQLDSNQLSGSIPNFSNVPKLDVLSANNNKLTGNVPSFSNSPKLIGLEVSLNLLTGTLPNLPSLQHLVINNNCSLTPYNSTQESLLNSMDSNWKKTNPECRALFTSVIGGGKITGNGISCTDAGGDCSEAFAVDTVVTLTAIPDPTYTFGGWGGCSSTSTSCQITMNAPKSVGQKVAATFNQACSYNLSQSNASHTANAETGSITVSTPTGCTWNAQSNADWIKITSQSNGVVNYSVAANTVTQSRSGTLTIADKTFTINQSPLVCTYSLNSTVANHGNKAETGSVNVTAPVGCNITAQSNADWITITSQNNGVVNYSVAANPTTQSRKGALTISDKTFTVEQSALDCTYSLSATNKTHAYNAESNTINVTAPAGCAWTAQNNASWINIISGQSGNGNGTITYNVAENTVASSRSSILNIGNQTFNVSQNAVPCSYKFSLSAMTYSSATTNTSVDLIAPEGCNWQATSNAAWITLVNNNGSGNGKVTYIVSANDTLDPREGNITIADQIFVIKQGIGNNQPPIARLTTVPSAPVQSVGSITVNLDGRSSTDPENQTLQYDWLASDGQKATGGTATFTFSQAGSYVITLTVTDNKGLTAAVKTEEIKVIKEGSPVALFTASPKLGEIPLQVNLDASKSNDPDGGDLVSYEWLAVKDDGKITFPAQYGKESSFRFDQEGIYLITLKVTDNEGQTAETSQTINAGVSKLSFNTYRCANSDLNGFSGCQINSEQSPYYTVGSKLKVALDSQTATNRFERLDLWTAIQLPDGQFLFMTSQPFNRFKFNQPPHYNGEAFMPNVEFANREDTVLEFDVPRNMSGKYIFYALYVALGKNPLLDSSSWKSNLAIKEITLE